MKIDAARDEGTTVLRLAGRLDREWAEQLSSALEDLLRSGARTLVIDFSGVTYVSSAAAAVLARCQQELAALRGEVQLAAISPAVREMFAIAGWDARGDGAEASAGPPADLRLSSWHLPAVAVRCGEYQTSACVPEASLRCRLHGHPDRLTRAAVGPGECDLVGFPGGVFGLGLGAIGASYEECRERLGELIGVAGCVAYFPSDGARLADYLVGQGQLAPRTVLASGLVCEGPFAKLVRFSARSDGESVPLSEVVGVCLEAVGGKLAGMVIAGETAGLCGARLRRSPAAGDAPLRFEVPAVRDWLSFAPERTHARTTALIAGVVARAPEGRLTAHLRPLGGLGRLHGHFHAAVFSYRPLPQRTVELPALLRALYQHHQLRDVLHLVWDDREAAGVSESALLRGVAWVGPVSQVVS